MRDSKLEALLQPVKERRVAILVSLSKSDPTGELFSAPKARNVKGDLIAE
jgi:hypothetical protein